MWHNVFWLCSDMLLELAQYRGALHVSRLVASKGEISGRYRAREKKMCPRRIFIGRLLCWLSDSKLPALNAPTVFRRSETHVAV